MKPEAPELFPRLTPPAGGIEALRASWVTTARVQQRRRRQLMISSVALLLLALLLPLHGVPRRAPETNPLLRNPPPETVASLIDLGLLPLPSEEVTVLPAPGGTAAVLKQDLAGDDDVVFYWLSPAPP